MTDNGIPFPEDKLGTNLGELPEEAEEESKEEEIRKAGRIQEERCVRVCV